MRLVVPIAVVFLLSGCSGAAFPGREPHRPTTSTPVNSDSTDGETILRSVTGVAVYENASWTPSQSDLLRIAGFRVITISDGSFKISDFNGSFVLNARNYGPPLEVQVEFLKCPHDAKLSASAAADECWQSFNETFSSITKRVESALSWSAPTGTWWTWLAAGENL